MKKIIALSGAFDPPTFGQIDMIKHATRLGNVVIILNSDEWILKSKRRIFLTREKRKKFLISIPGVVDIVDAIDLDGTVCESLKELKPDMFGNGGPRTPENTPEIDLCRDMDIELIWQVGSVEDAKNTLKIYDAALKFT